MVVYPPPPEGKRGREGGPKESSKSQTGKGGSGTEGEFMGGLAQGGQWR